MQCVTVSDEEIFRALAPESEASGLSLPCCCENALSYVWLIANEELIRGLVWLHSASSVRWGATNEVCWVS